jgi:hypothetical protein
MVILTADEELGINAAPDSHRTPTLDWQREIVNPVRHSAKTVTVTFLMTAVTKTIERLITAKDGYRIVDFV